MAEEASVRLAAEDAISRPSLDAVSALEALKRSVKELTAATKDVAPATASATNGVGNLAAASAHSVTPHSAVHKAIGLVTSGMTELQGASKGVEGAVRVLDSVMVSMAMSGGALSVGFIGLIATAVGIGVAIKSMAEESKKAKEEIDGLVKSGEDAALVAERLTRANREMATIGASKAIADVTSLRSKLAEAESEQKKLTETNSNANIAWLATGQSVQIATTYVKGSNKEIAESHEKIVALKQALQDATEKYNAFHLASVGVGVSDRGGDTEEAKKAADAQIAIKRAQMSMQAAMMMQTDGMNKRAYENDLHEFEKAEEAKRILARQTSNIITTAASSAAAAMGSAAMAAAMGTADAWSTAVQAIIGDIVRMAIQFVEKHIIMAEAAALVHEVSTKGLIGLATGMAAIAAISAVGIALTGAIGKGGGASGASGGSVASAAASGLGSHTVGPAGGTPVSSAQQVVNNNISINLGVQAMDLSSVSNNQMQDLATRIARLIAAGATGGQLSLAAV